MCRRARVPPSLQAQLAVRQGKAVVSPGWLTACKFAWARVPEAEHPATRQQGPRKAAVDAKEDLEAALKSAGQAG